MKKICKNCQYYRDYDWSNELKAGWCSNSKSPKALVQVKEDDTCPEFYECGKKAPLWMRKLAKILERLTK